MILAVTVFDVPSVRFLGTNQQLERPCSGCSRAAVSDHTSAGSGTPTRWPGRGVRGAEPAGTVNLAQSILARRADANSAPVLRDLLVFQTGNDKAPSWRKEEGGESYFSRSKWKQEAASKTIHS